MEKERVFHERYIQNKTLGSSGHAAKATTLDVLDKCKFETDLDQENRTPSIST